MKILNILNGDATLYKFRQTALSGDVLVWRETLSEGPVLADSEKAFFKLRSDWISKVYNSNAEEYQKQVIDEFSRLKTYSDYDEILFWFEFDLYCQINLIFLLSFFQDKILGKTVLSLICPNQHPNHSDFRGIGQLSPQELSELTDQKLYLNKQDIHIAVEAWEVYASDDKKKMENFLKKDFGQLSKLHPALIAHLDRFPDKETGLNKVEDLLITIIKTGITDRKSIYQEFWKTTAIYGMGDAQIDLYIKKLINNRNIVHLKEYE